MLAFTFINGYMNVVVTLSNIHLTTSITHYPLQTRHWTQIASMANHRHGLCVTTLEGPIYAIGGHDGMFLYFKILIGSVKQLNIF